MVLRLPMWTRALLALLALAAGSWAANQTLVAYLAREQLRQAEAHLAWGRLDEALTSLKKARRLTSGDAEVHRQIGAMQLNRYRLQGRTEAADEAANAYLQATELNPLNADILAEFGWALIHLGRVAGAVLAFEDALELDPNNLYVLTSLAEAQELMDQPEAAVETYRRALAVRNEPEVRERLEALEEQLAGADE